MAVESTAPSCSSGALFFAERPEHAAGRASSDAPVGDAARHDTASSNRASLSDCHAGHDDRSSAHPGVLSDGYGQTSLESLLALLDRDRVGAAVDADVGAEQHAVAQTHLGAVEDGGVVVGVERALGLDVGAVVAPQRRLDLHPGHLLWRQLEQLRQQTLAILRHEVLPLGQHRPGSAVERRRGLRLVVLDLQTTRLDARTDQVLRVGQVRQPDEHLLLLTHLVDLVAILAVDLVEEFRCGRHVCSCLSSKSGRKRCGAVLAQTKRDGRSVALFKYFQRKASKTVSPATRVSGNLGSDPRQVRMPRPISLVHGHQGAPRILTASHGRAQPAERLCPRSDTELRPRLRRPSLPPPPAPRNGSFNSLVPSSRRQLWFAARKTHRPTPTI
ncbi:hypothetical protein L1887_47983 [Cichorium endivia]|nr:hypothetical protein L1887_47983 [Cichorium endivia]